MMQPLSIATRARSAPCAPAITPVSVNGRPRSRGASAALVPTKGSLCATESRRTRPAARSAATKGRRRPGRAITSLRKSARRRQESGAAPRSTASARACSMIRPKGTPDGQTASQFRHCRQESRWPSAFGVGSITPSEIARIKYSLPRGDSVSSRVST